MCDSSKERRPKQDNVDETSTDNGHAGANGKPVIPATPTVKQEPIDAYLFKNYDLIDVGKNGDTKWERIPRYIGQISKMLDQLTPGWPKRVGKDLFAPTAKGVPLYLDSKAKLFAWINGRVKVDWRRGPDFVEQEVLYEYERMVAPEYDAIETLPHWPKMDRVYYMHSPIGDPAGKLDELIGLFCASDIDRQLIKALIVTLFWGGPAGKRPAFLVTGPDNDANRGRGVGKSTLIDIITQELVDGFVNVSATESMPDIKIRLLSSESGRKRVVRLDNVKTLRLSWADLEGEITSPVISGKALYKGEGRRPNTLIWLITLNGASLSKDMALRTIPIKIDRPVFDANWESNVRGFIREHRQSILGDVREFLEKKPGELASLSRWTEWDTSILSKLNGCENVQVTISQRQLSIDNDDEEQDIYNTFICKKLVSIGLDPEIGAAIIPSRMMTQWVNEAGNLKLSPIHGSAFVNNLGIRNLTKSDRKGSRFWKWTGDKWDGSQPVPIETELPAGDWSKADEPG
jgi:hypothetical protein